jgi:hypothetical protein
MYCCQHFDKISDSLGLDFIEGLIRVTLLPELNKLGKAAAADQLKIKPGYRSGFGASRGSYYCTGHCSRIRHYELAGLQIFVLLSFGQ